MRRSRGDGVRGVRTGPPLPPPPEFWQKCGYRIREWAQFDIAHIYVEYNRD